MIIHMASLPHQTSSGYGLQAIYSRQYVVNIGMDGRMTRMVDHVHVHRPMAFVKTYCLLPMYNGLSTTLLQPTKSVILSVGYYNIFYEMVPQKVSSRERCCKRQEPL